MPLIVLFTNRTSELEGCYESCGLYAVVIFYIYEIPSGIFWGVPMWSMMFYSLIGRRIGLKGSLLKFMILYTTRYGGLLWHIVSQLIGVWLVYAQLDFIFPFIYLVTSVLLEQAYTEVGGEALRYIDPTWTQNPDAAYPFAV